MRRLKVLLLVTIATVSVLVVWGGVVRLSGSGLAIPDWPLAEGKLLPRPQVNVLIEYIHRAIAGVVGCLTVVIAALVYRDRRARARLGWLAAAALAVLGIQVFLGARVVLEELPVDRVVMHLLAAFLFFAILIRMALRAPDAEADARADRASVGPRPRHPWLRIFAYVAVAAVFAQVGLGGWVSSSGAALACPDFPRCHGSWLPELTGLMGIHYGHRLAAYAVLLLVLGLLIAAASAPLSRRGRWSLRLSGILVALQVLLGIGNVLLRVPLAVSAAHLGTALALFGTLLVAGYEISHA